MVGKIREEGGEASGHLVNAVKEGEIERLVEEVERIGRIDVLFLILGLRLVCVVVVVVVVVVFEEGEKGRKKKGEKKIIEKGRKWIYFFN